MLTRIFIILSIVAGVIFLYKGYALLLRASAIEGFDPYSPEALETLKIMIGFTVVLLGSFMKEIYRFWVCTLAMLCPIYVFFTWAVYSYKVIHSEKLGWLAKANKLGLVGAEYEHVVMLLATILLSVVTVVEIISYVKARNGQPLTER